MTTSLDDMGMATTAGIEKTPPPRELNARVESAIRTYWLSDSALWTNQIQHCPVQHCPDSITSESPRWHVMQDAHLDQYDGKVGKAADQRKH
jgi:hypothetical protein